MVTFVFFVTVGLVSCQIKSIRIPSILLLEFKGDSKDAVSSDNELGLIKAFLKLFKSFQASKYIDSVEDKTSSRKDL